VRKVCEIDAEYLRTESDIIAEKQPFIISLLLGYQIDLEDDQLDDILRVLLLIWEFFKDKHEFSGKQKIGIRSYFLVTPLKGLPSCFPSIQGIGFGNLSDCLTFTKERNLKTNSNLSTDRSPIP